MILIFTDGAARGNPGPGGWGAIVASDDTVTEIGGQEHYTTNNRMEITAAIKALEVSFIQSNEPVTLYTDSAYVLSGVTRWVIGWQRSGWKTSKKEEVLNRDLWETLVELVHHRSVEWKLLKGHSGVPANERCDVIATSFADMHPVILYKGSRSRYGVSLGVPTKESSDSTKKAKSKTGPAYSYVSMVQGVIQTHATWEECKARVSGTSGARFKKAVSQEHEEEIIREFKG
jgi:ribonuclease HI